MRAKGWLAIGLAAATAAAVWTYLRAVERAYAGGAPAAVLVARESLPRGARLGERDGAIREVPARYVHPEAIARGEVADYLGRPLANAVAAGQPILKTDFELRSTAADRPLSALVPKGMRALTIPVDAAASVGGLLRPGDRVDVLGTFARDGRADKATVTLLQNVPVLATGSRTEAAPAGAAGAPARARGESYGHVTLAVTLEEAELLAFGATRGDLHVALRHDEDVQVAEDLPEKDLRDLFEVEKRADLMRRHRTIEVLRPGRR